tara:strand:- start:312 stop:557 length:246 start_codon:yes stop_codon:yes gene_type:complete
MNQVNKKNIVKNIEKLPDYVHIEIYKFLINKIDKNNYTINSNGFFYNINNLDNKILIELDNLIKFYINNEKILEKENEKFI